MRMSSEGLYEEIERTKSAPSAPPREPLGAPRTPPKASIQYASVETATGADVSADTVMYGGDLYAKVDKGDRSAGTRAVADEVPRARSVSAVVYSSIEDDATPTGPPATDGGDGDDAYDEVSKAAPSIRLTSATDGYDTVVDPDASLWSTAEDRRQSDISNLSTSSNGSLPPPPLPSKVKPAGPTAGADASEAPRSVSPALPPHPPRPRSLRTSPQSSPRLPPRTSPQASPRLPPRSPRQLSPQASPRGSPRGSPRSSPRSSPQSSPTTARRGAKSAPSSPQLLRRPKIGAPPPSTPPARQRHSVTSVALEAALWQQSWYFGSRKADATIFLEARKHLPGTFAVRDSSSHPGESVLMYVHPNGTIHMTHIKIHTGAERGYYLASSLKPRVMPSVSALIQSLGDTEAPEGLACQLRLPRALGRNASARASRTPVPPTVKTSARPPLRTAPQQTAPAPSGGADRVTAINPAAWYFGSLPKARCNELIWTATHGTFLVRDSSSSAGYVLVVNEHGQVGSYPMSRDGESLKFAHTPYKSLVDVVERGREGLFTGKDGAVLEMIRPAPGGKLYNPSASSRQAMPAPPRGAAAPRRAYNAAGNAVGKPHDSDAHADGTLKANATGVLYAVVKPQGSDKAVGAPGPAYEGLRSAVHGDCAAEASEAADVEGWTSPCLARDNVVYICYCEDDLGLAVKVAEAFDMAAIETGASLAAFVSAVELAEIPITSTRDFRYTAMRKAAAIVVIASAAATAEIASAETSASLFFQCECLWAVRMASGKLQPHHDQKARSTPHVIPFVPKRSAKDTANVSVALTRMGDLQDSGARAVALEALEELARLPSAVRARGKESVLVDSDDVDRLVGKLLTAPPAPSRSVRSGAPGDAAATAPAVNAYRGAASAATVDLSCVLSDKFKVIHPGQTDTTAKSMTIRLMGLEGGCDCGVLEMHERKSKRKKTGTLFPHIVLDLKSCLGLDISNTPKQADCIKLTFEGKGTYMLIANIDILRDWIEAIREQWKGGSTQRATEEFLRDSDAKYIAHCSFQAQTKAQVSVVAGEQVTVQDFGPTWYTITTASGDSGLVPSSVIAYKDAEDDFC